MDRSEIESLLTARWINLNTEDGTIKLFIGGLPSTATAWKIKEFVETKVNPGLLDRLFSQKIELSRCEIFYACSQNDRKRVYRFAVISVAPDSKANAVMRALRGTRFQGRSLSIRPYHNRLAVRQFGRREYQDNRQSIVSKVDVWASSNRDQFNPGTERISPARVLFDH